MPKLKPQTINFLRKLIADMAIIVCVGVVLALGVNQCRGPQGKIALIDKSQWVEEEVVDADVVNELSGLNSITPELAYVKMQAKPVVFVDSRHPVEYAKGHIKDAVSFPYEEFGEHIGLFLDAYPPNTVIIVYCDGKNCEQSELLGQELVFAGYETVYYMQPNWLSWLNSGKPVDILNR